MIINLPQHPIDNVEWLNQASAVRWDKNDILQASREFWTFAVVCVFCTPAIKSFGFSASGLNRHFHMVLSIRYLSHHTFSWKCILTHLLYLDSPSEKSSSLCLGKREVHAWRYMSHFISKDSQLSTTCQRVYHDVFSPFLL